MHSVGLRHFYFWKWEKKSIFVCGCRRLVLGLFTFTHTISFSSSVCEHVVLVVIVRTDIANGRKINMHTPKMNIFYLLDLCKFTSLVSLQFVVCVTSQKKSFIKLLFYLSPPFIHIFMHFLTFFYSNATPSLAFATCGDTTSHTIVFSKSNRKHGMASMLIFVKDLKRKNGKIDRK